MPPYRRLTLAAAVLAIAPLAEAKFGITKTRVLLKRVRPPEIGLVGDTVSVRVASEARGVSDRQLEAIRDRVEGAVDGYAGLRLVEGGGQNAVVVQVDHLEARISDTVVYEERQVKTGEREEWDEKKKKYVKRDVYEYRREPVRLRSVRGRVEARVTAEGPGGERYADAGASYQDEFKGDVRVPAEASSEALLERWLVEAAARRAAAAVSASGDPVEALLAVDGELKEGNRLAQAGLWPEALAQWTKRTMKGGKEAARLHNVGVAHEAMAYALPPESEDHRARLEEAAEHYRRALALDPKEKYFAEPIQRLETSRDYAMRAVSQAAEARHWREAREAEERARQEKEAQEAEEARAREARRQAEAARAAEAARPRAPAAPRRPASPRPESRPAPPAPPPPSAPAATPAPPAPEGEGLAASAVALRTPLSNGSFESGLEPWKAAGQGSVIPFAGHGRVFQAAAGRAGTTLAQPVDLDLRAAPAHLALAYRVVSGPAQVRVLVVYDDTSGRSRTASLDVSAAASPGDWTSWKGDLVGLRPRPARLREVRIAVEGGTVLLDNVVLSLD